MKKLNAKEQQRIIGGGRCPILCDNTPLPGATYTGDCSLPLPFCGGNYVYIITANCGGPSTYTYCTTGLMPD